jgi:tRNA A-37 threonylcarbamoyl transferase component Bud32
MDIYDHSSKKSKRADGTGNSSTGKFKNSNINFTKLREHLASNPSKFLYKGQTATLPNQSLSNATSTRMPFGAKNSHDNLNTSESVKQEGDSLNLNNMRVFQSPTRDVIGHSPNSRFLPDLSGSLTNKHSQQNLTKKTLEDQYRLKLSRYITGKSPSTEQVNTNHFSSRVATIPVQTHSHRDHATLNSNYLAKISSNAFAKRSASIDKPPPPTQENLEDGLNKIDKMINSYRPGNDNHSDKKPAHLSQREPTIAFNLKQPLVSPSSNLKNAEVGSPLFSKALRENFLSKPDVATTQGISSYLLDNPFGSRGKRLRNLDAAIGETTKQIGSLDTMFRKESYDTQGSKILTSKMVVDESTRQSQSVSSTIYHIKWVANEWDDYSKTLRFDKLLGQGSFAKVYHGIDLQTMKDVAIKSMEKRKLIELGVQKMIEKELEIIQSIKHPNICQFKRMVEDKKRIFFVLELCGSQTLSQMCRSRHSKCFSEPEAFDYFIQLLKAVDYLHHKGICHRDLKLTNILVDDLNTVKLIDFGFAENTLRPLKGYCGTPSYMAPELAQRREYLGRAVDVWALGVVLFRLVTGEYAFGGEDDPRLNEKICKGKVDFPSYVSIPCRELISSCLIIDLRHRCTTSQLLKSKWVQQHTFQNAEEADQSP